MFHGTPLTNGARNMEYEDPISPMNTTKKCNYSLAG